MSYLQHWYKKSSPRSTKKYYQISSMWGHLKSTHKDQHSQASEKKYETSRKLRRKEVEDTDRAHIYLLEPRERRHETLAQTLERKIKYLPDHLQQIECRTLMGHWLCDALLPYTTTENQQFVNMIAHFTKRFNVPSDERKDNTRHP